MLKKFNWCSRWKPGHAWGQPYSQFPHSDVGAAGVNYSRPLTGRRRARKLPRQRRSCRANAASGAEAQSGSTKLRNRSTFDNLAAANTNDAHIANVLSSRLTGNTRSIIKGGILFRPCKSVRNDLVSTIKLHQSTRHVPK